jgi:lipopolysaccharide biosynthesis glycosyltransferase
MNQVNSHCGVIPVVLCCDQKFLPHAAATIASVLCNKSSETAIKIYLLYSKVAHQDLNKLEAFINTFDNATFEGIDVGLIFKNAITFPKLSTAMYYRLIIPEILSEEKAIYLDCDTIVTTDLKELFLKDIEDKYIAAVLSPGSYKNRVKINKKTNRKIFYLDYLSGLGMSPEIAYDYYINSGVLVINNERFREDGLLKKMEHLIQKNDYLFAPDQDVLNAVTLDQKLILDLEWNYQTTLLKYKGYIKNTNVREWFDDHPDFKNTLNNIKNTPPKIIHFVYNKPWNMHKVFGKYDSFYWFYLKQTPWKHLSHKKYIKYIMAPLINIYTFLFDLIDRVKKKISNG